MNILQIYWDTANQTQVTKLANYYVQTNKIDHKQNKNKRNTENIVNVDYLQITVFLIELFQVLTIKYLMQVNWAASNIPLIAPLCY